jgi:hypothetical protein
VIRVPVLRVVHHCHAKPGVKGEQSNRHNDDQQRQRCVHVGDSAGDFVLILGRVYRLRSRVASDLRKLQAWDSQQRTEDL